MLNTLGKFMTKKIILIILITFLPAQQTNAAIINNKQAAMLGAAFFSVFFHPGLVSLSTDVTENGATGYVYQIIDDDFTRLPVQTVTVSMNYKSSTKLILAHIIVAGVVYKFIREFK